MIQASYFAMTSARVPSAPMTKGLPRGCLVESRVLCVRCRHRLRACRVRESLWWALLRWFVASLAILAICEPICTKPFNSCKHLTTPGSLVPRSLFSAGAREAPSPPSWRTWKPVPRMVPRQPGMPWQPIKPPTPRSKLWPRGAPGELESSCDFTVRSHRLVRSGKKCIQLAKSATCIKLSAPTARVARLSERD